MMVISVFMMLHDEINISEANQLTGFYNVAILVSIFGKTDEEK